MSQLQILLKPYCKPSFYYTHFHIPRRICHFLLCHWPSEVIPLFHLKQLNCNKYIKQEWHHNTQQMPCAGPHKSNDNCVNKDPTFFVNVPYIMKRATYCFRNKMGFRLHQVQVYIQKCSYSGWNYSFHMQVNHGMVQMNLEMVWNFDFPILYPCFPSYFLEDLRGYWCAGC